MNLVYLLLWGTLGSSAYPNHLQTQVTQYHRCLRADSGAACTKQWYEPIYDFCQDRPGECSALLRLADPGALSFRRCARLDSCAFAGTQAPDHFLNVVLVPRDQWVELDIFVRTGSDGVLDMYSRGIPLVAYRGPLGYLNLPNYFKFGVYDYTVTQKSDFEIHFKDFARTLVD